jgi:bifunctional NMN adenylyltransferase/nudix hydrolase
VNKPSYGVIVGRFQVHELHEGHMELIRAVKGRHTRVIAFVGVSPNLFTKRNPLDFITRKAMIQAKFPDVTVLPLLDQVTDEAWSELLDSKIREVTGYGDVTLYGGRDSFVPHYHGSFRPVELNLVGTEHIKSEDIRNSLTNNVVESADFRAGVIYAAMNQWPKVITCVDVVMYHYSWRGGDKDGNRHDDFELLLAKKPGEPGWRFVGGHAEPNLPSFETDARAEAFQEVGQSLTKMEYIGSALIDDWRWAAEQDKVKTLVFASETMTLECKAKDDISNAKWFPISQVTEGLINPVHHPILKLVQARFAKEINLYTTVRA